MARASRARSRPGGRSSRQACIPTAAVTGAWPVRGTWFREIRLSFELETNASDEELETLLKLTERYCVVYQTLAAGVPVSLSHGVSR